MRVRMVARLDAVLAVVLAGVLAGVLTGCGDPGTATGPEADGDGVASGEWILVDGVPMVEGYPITLRITDGEVGGTAACNSYGGEVRSVGDTFEVGDLARTEMGCPAAGVHDSESAYLDALMVVERQAREGEQLVLSGPDVELRFDPVAPEPDAALGGTQWRLESLVSGHGPDGSVSSTMAAAALRLDDDGTFAASDGCNDQNGRWELDGEVLRLSEVVTTDVACPDLQQQTEHVHQVLFGDPATELEGRSLTLVSGDLGLQYRAD
jgi:heat shock protein HslJ